MFRRKSNNIDVNLLEKGDFSNIENLIKDNDEKQRLSNLSNATHIAKNNVRIKVLNLSILCVIIYRQSNIL